MARCEDCESWQYAPGCGQCRPGDAAGVRGAARSLRQAARSGANAACYSGCVTDAETLRRDRRRFHAHTATALIGFFGWLGVVALERLILHAVIPWLLVGFSLVALASGVLAVMVKRTFMTGPVEPEEGDDPYADVGDALGSPGLHGLDLAPAYTRAVAPYGVLGVGLTLLALSVYWAIAGLPGS